MESQLLSSYTFQQSMVSIFFTFSFFATSWLFFIFAKFMPFVNSGMWWRLRKIITNGKNVAKKEENPFFVFCHPFFDKKRKICEERKFSFFVGNHTFHVKNVQNNFSNYHKQSVMKLLQGDFLSIVYIASLPQRWFDPKIETNTWKSL